MESWLKQSDQLRNEGQQTACSCSASRSAHKPSTLRGPGFYTPSLLPVVASANDDTSRRLLLAKRASVDDCICESRLPCSFLSEMERQLVAKSECQPVGANAHEGGGEATKPGDIPLHRCYSLGHYTRAWSSVGK